MAFITLANTGKIIFESDTASLDLEREIYKIPIYFFSKYEQNALRAIQELLENPENYFSEIYKPYKPVDTHRYVYEGQKPAFHKYSCCPRLHSDYQNFEIPKEIQEKGTEVVEEFRKWFEKNKYLLDDPEAFAFRLKASKFRIDTNPKAINIGNSGAEIKKNLSIEELETTIDALIKAAGRFYYESTKNKAILKRWSKYTHLARKPEPIDNNDTGYSDQEVKELLRTYEARFKKPLKQHLIEYYRLKLNPNIKMEGEYLEQLGFSPCGQCHSEDYVPSDTTNEGENTDSPD